VLTTATDLAQARLKHLRQIRAASGAAVVPILRLLYRTVCRQFSPPKSRFGFRRHVRQPCMMNEAMIPTNADRMTPAATPCTKISLLFIADLYALGRFDGTVKLERDVDASSERRKLPPELPPDASESIQITPYKAGSR
jgi:hypothetical protein